MSETAPSPPWDAVTAAFDGELRAWEAYAAEVRAWADALAARVAAGQPPTPEHRRVAGDIAPEAMREQAEWVAGSAERVAGRLRETLASGDVPAALLAVLRPGPGARGFDYRAPGFWHGPREPGDLRPLWEVRDRERCDALHDALAPDAPPAWFLASLQAWARPLARALWTDAYAHETMTRAYAEHLAATGNPWQDGRPAPGAA